MNRANAVQSKLRRRKLNLVSASASVANRVTTCALLITSKKSIPLLPQVSPCLASHKPR